MKTIAARRWMACLTLLLAPALAAQTALVEFQGVADGDAAGTSVARLGDLDRDGVPDFAVGAPHATLDGPSSGAVWVVSSATGDVLRVLDGSAPGDLFGSWVANAGDVDADGIDDIAVGASQDSDSASTGWAAAGPGYAKVFSGADGSLLHVWQGEHGLNPDFNSFGRVVLGVGDLDHDGHDDVAVAEREAEVDGVHEFDPVGGRVWVFSGRTGTVLHRLEGLGPRFAHLGWSVAGGADHDDDGTLDLAIGAPIDNGTSSHAVIVSGATGQVLLEAFGSTAFGWGIDFLGDVDDDGVTDIVSGASTAALIHSGATGALLHTTPAFTNAGSHTGVPVAAIGDVDGDGRGDFAAGDRAATASAAGSGSVKLYSGRTGQTLLVVLGTDASAALGTSVSIAPDLDGDGIADLLLGAPGHEGGTAGIYSTFALKLSRAVYSPNAIDTDFGQRVAAAGDVDNDGWGDVVVGLPVDGSIHFLGGRAQVFSGRDGALLHDLLGDGVYDRFGWSVASAGDANGDGHADVIVGAPYPTATTGPAYARVVSGLDGSTLHQFDGHATGDQFGTAVACVGDLDRDGRDDVAVSAPNEALVGSPVGRVYVYSGRTGGELLIVPGTAGTGGFGKALAAAGDIDGDGTLDILIGARDATTPNGFSSGLARVVSGADGSVLHEVHGDAAGDQAGWAVAGLGDVDGDGRGDFAVGIPSGDSSTSASGIVRIYSGLDASVLHELSSKAADGPFGQAIVGIGDIDEDGAGELAIGLALGNDAGPGSGRVAIHSGATGELLVSWPGPYAGNLAGWVVDSRGNFAGDGDGDLVVGANGSTEDPAPAGAVYIVNPRPAATPWQSLGAKLPGAHGAPTLVGEGSLLPGEWATVTLGHALENTVATLVIGTASLNAPFKGGTLVPFPQILVFGLPTGPLGQIVLTAPWPPDLPPGFTMLAQFWIADPAGPFGHAASNALLGTAP